MSHGKLLHRIIKFLLSGGLGVMLYYATLYILTEKVGLWYLASAVIGSILNIAVNFVTHKYWTFNDRRHQVVMYQLRAYVTVWVVMACGNAMMLFELVEDGANYLYAQLYLSVIFSAISYWLTSHVFNRPEEDYYPYRDPL